MAVLWPRVMPVIDNSVRELCARPYPNHKKGCPNHGKRSYCPPGARLFFRVIDERDPTYAVFNIFDFGGHVEKMKERHPGWSGRQLGNCLYWQGTARKQLKEKVKSFLDDKKRLLAVYCPEACGVNVTATMESIGERLEWPPRTKTYQVALVGTALVHGGTTTGNSSCAKR